MIDIVNKIKNKLEKDKKIIIHCKLTTNAQKNEFKQILENQTIKIAISAPPEKGKANNELINFLSKTLNIEKSKISILVGKTTKNKLIQIGK